jgi:DNA-binding transcriptional LysR family regulator
MINFEWYRSSIEVYRVGTVSGAAQVLHLTQPAVSQHVAARESALGNPLFQRTPRRMVPTEAGQRLYTQIAGAMRNSNQFRTKAQPPKLHKPSESVRPKNFLPIDFWVNYHRTIALFTLYNFGEQQS